MKQNLTSDFQRCTTLTQRHYPTLKERQNNVTQRRNTVAQRCCNVDTSLFQPRVDFSQSYIESSQVSDYHGFANRRTVFILLNEKIFCTIY